MLKMINATDYLVTIMNDSDLSGGQQGVCTRVGRFLAQLPKVSAKHATEKQYQNMIDSSTTVFTEMICI